MEIRVEIKDGEVRAMLTNIIAKGKGIYCMGGNEQAAPGNCSVLHRNIRNPGPLRWISNHYSTLNGDIKRSGEWLVVSGLIAISQQLSTIHCQLSTINR